MGVCGSVSVLSSIVYTKLTGGRYEKRRRRDTQRTPTYHFMGYSTLYPFYCFPERVRMRLRCINATIFSRTHDLIFSTLTVNSSSSLRINTKATVVRADRFPSHKIRFVNCQFRLLQHLSTTPSINSSCAKIESPS